MIGLLLVGGSPEGLVDDRLLPSQTGGRDGCGGTSIADADATGWSAQDTPDEVVDPGRCRPCWYGGATGSRGRWARGDSG